MVDHLRSGVWGHPGQVGETPSLLKIQKLAKCGGTSLSSQLLGRLRQENHLNAGGEGCSELRSCHCAPAWVTEPDSVSEKKKITYHALLETEDIAVQKNSQILALGTVEDVLKASLTAVCSISMVQHSSHCSSYKQNESNTIKKFSLFMVLPILSGAQTPHMATVWDIPDTEHVYHHRKFD